MLERGLDTASQHHHLAGEILEGQLDDLEALVHLLEALVHLLEALVHLLEANLGLVRRSANFIADLLEETKCVVLGLDARSAYQRLVTVTTAWPGRLHFSRGGISATDAGRVVFVPHRRESYRLVDRPPPRGLQARP
jgi:hypothetical protein